MGIVSLQKLGQYGLNLDTAPAELPPGAWSEGSNARFQNGSVKPFMQDSDLSPDVPVAGYWCIGMDNPEDGRALWCVLGLAKAYVYLGGVWTEVTRLAGDYLATETRGWSGGNLSSVIVANNGIDPPQALTTFNPLGKFADLANWPANTTCACMRTFKQFLVALDVSKTGVRYPTLVKWSHPADPGTVPVSWNEADTTKDAGEYPLSETPGAVVDLVPLKDVAIIYKQDSVWGMQYVGGTFIFRFYKIFGDFGIPARDCAIEFSSGKHMVYTGTDLVIHDGNSYRSVATQRMRILLRRIGLGGLNACFMALDQAHEEVWFCFRQKQDGVIAADTALVYNWAQDTLTLRDLADYRYITAGRLDPSNLGAVTWNAFTTETWEDGGRAWDTGQDYAAWPRLLGLRGVKFSWLDSGVMTFDPLYLVRTELGVPIKAQQPPDMTTMKFLRRVWPRLKGQTGDQVKLTFGAQDRIGGPVRWAPPKLFTIGTDLKMDMTLPGRLFAMKVESTGTREWALDGLDADVKFEGDN